MPWMTHINCLRKISKSHSTPARYRSHFFNNQFDRIPICQAMDLDKESYTIGEHAPRCPKCEKKLEKLK